MIKFILDDQIQECVSLKPLTCEMLYEGNTHKYFLLVEHSLYKAENENGIFSFEYVKELEVEKSVL